MQKKGAGRIFSSKGGEVSVALLTIAFLLFLIMAVFVSSVGVQYSKPETNEINTSTSRNINFTFTPTWNNTGEVIGNCSLWTNFTGTWSSMAEFNGTMESTSFNGSSNISNSTLSWINYTFTGDRSVIVWNIACRNGTQSAAVLNFSVSNRTLAIDRVAPNITYTSDVWPGYNTSDETPTITITVADTINGSGTGINLTTNGNNATLNITILDVNSGTDTEIKGLSFNQSTLNLSCSPTGDSMTSTTCTVGFNNWALTNGTKNITISVSDRAGWVNFTSFTFTVDQIPPKFDQYNFTHNATIDYIDPAGIGLNASDFSGSAQGRTIYGRANWTDNLTETRRGYLQFYNTTTPAWQTINSTSALGAGNGSWTNLSYTIPTGHNEFEGKNVSFRIIANDTLGNINNSATAKNFTIKINDTTKPTITINGTIAVNGTNTTNTRPIIGWFVEENNKLLEINVSVDAAVNNDDGCNKFGRYTTIAGVNNIETGDGGRGWRNGSFQIASDAACTLGNGTHFIVVQARDTWNNVGMVNHTFNVQSGSVPALVFNSVTDLNRVTISNPSVSAVNKSNLTSKMGLNFSGFGGAISIANLSYVSSCNPSSTVYFSNSTVIYPFNSTSDVACGTTSANRTLTVTVIDTAGTSNSTVFGFTLDNVAPTITVHSPTSGQTFSSVITNVNVSAYDSESQIQWIGYYLDGLNVLLNHTMNGSRLTDDFGQNRTYYNGTNFTPGTHTIKISVNDTLGNIGNSSVITFTQTGPVTFLDITQSLSNYSTAAYSSNITNVTVRMKTDTGYQTITASNETSTNTFEIYFEINGTSDNVNLSLTEINGSAVNWQRINFTPIINDTQTEGFITTNWTNTILRAVTINNSLSEFITNNNSYYGVVILPYNISGSVATAQEFWWIPDAAAVATRTNISECTGGFSRTTTTPCWNYTSGGRTIIQVPHFSSVAAVNDTTPPTVTRNLPASAQRVSGFIPNATVSADAQSCKYILNITSLDANTSATANVSSSATPSTVGSNIICSWSEIRFKNGVYNITYNVTDASGNVNLTSSAFTVLDATAPNGGTSISASPSTTTAIVTITGVNESVNATVWYSTVNTSFTASFTQTTFSTSPSVSLTGLSASTTYYYNVTLYDYNGNSVLNSTVFSFATTAAASSSTTTSSSSSSSGGSAVTQTTASNAAASASRSWDSLAADSTGTFKVSSDNIAFTNILIAVTSTVSNPTVGVSSLTSNPQSGAPSDKVYQYLEITHTNIADSDISKATISFKVPKSWLTANNVAEGDIVLYRYNSGQWNELPTTITSSDADNVWYEAVTPGFSDYAIGSKSGAVSTTTPETTPTEQPAETPAATTPTEQPAAGTTPQPVESKPIGKNTLAWIVVAIIVIAAALGFVMWQKKKSQK